MKDKTFANSTVLVTGASSSIGHAIAVYLAQQGYCVLASIRKEADAEKLKGLGLENIKPVCPLDLTSQEHIATVIQLIIEEVQSHLLPPLHAVILVAGGGHIAPIELMKIEHFREELEKRLVGTISLIQKIIPLLRQTQGRIFWIATPDLFPVPYVTDIHTPDFSVNYLLKFRT